MVPMIDPVAMASTKPLVARRTSKRPVAAVAGERYQAWSASPAPTTPGPEVALADGNRASVGDLIITRSNDRRLRTSATDWVKNGDRWTVLNLTTDRWAEGAARPERPHRRRCPPTTSAPLPNWATPPPCTPRKASPPTPCTASSPVRSPGSSCTPC